MIQRNNKEDHKIENLVCFLCDLDGEEHCQDTWLVVNLLHNKKDPSKERKSSQYLSQFRQFTEQDSAYKINKVQIKSQPKPHIHKTPNKSWDLELLREDQIWKSLWVTSSTINLSQKKIMQIFIHVQSIFFPSNLK